MTLASGIIELLVLLLPVILTAIANHNDAAAKLSDQNEKIDQAIASNDVKSVTVILNDSLDKLQDSNESHIK